MYSVKSMMKHKKAKTSHKPSMGGGKNLASMMKASNGSHSSAKSSRSNDNSVIYS